MEPVIELVPAPKIDDLELLWTQLLAHHGQKAPHLSALGAVRSPEDSWHLRRSQYLDWMQEPLTRVLAARGADGLIGYAVVRVVEAPGSWMWGDRVGVLETLVVDVRARGTGVGQYLLEAARQCLAESGIQVMKISVIAGNDAA